MNSDMVLDTVAEIRKKVPDSTRSLKWRERFYSMELDMLLPVACGATGLMLEKWFIKHNTSLPGLFPSLKLF